jgi:hypothetical protein
MSCNFSILHVLNKGSVWALYVVLFIIRIALFCSLNILLLVLLCIAEPHAVIPYNNWECTREKYKVCNAILGNKCLALFIANKVLEILLLICCIWNFQVKCSSICIPRNFIDFSLPILLIWVIACSFIVRR